MPLANFASNWLMLGISLMPHHRKAKLNRAAQQSVAVENRRQTRIGLVVGLVLVACGALLSSRFHWRANGSSGSELHGTEYETPRRASAAGFRPTVENHGAAPGNAPKGMVWIPGGEFS